MTKRPGKINWAILGILIGFVGVIAVGGATILFLKSSGNGKDEEKSVAKTSDKSVEKTPEKLEKTHTDEVETKEDSTKTGQAPTTVKSEAPKIQEIFPEDFAQWTQADYLRARQSKNSRLLQAVTHLIKTKPDNEETVTLLKKLIQFDPKKDKKSAFFETVWVDDAAPEGAQLKVQEGGRSWRWVSQPAHPVYSGTKSMFRQAKGSEMHYFEGAKNPLKIEKGDKLFAYVYLDPANPPKAIMFQFKDESKVGAWEHRAYWGENKFSSPGRIAMGKLPKTGRWSRLEVEAAKVGLEPGSKLNGWAFAQFDGKAYYDKAGASQGTSAKLTLMVIAALAASKTPAAIEVLKSLLSGGLVSQLPDEQAVGLTLKAILDKVQQKNGRNQPLEKMLMTVLVEPGKLRAPDDKSLSADKLQHLALEQFRAASSAQWRSRLATFMVDGKATGEQLARLREFLSEPVAKNVYAQVILYQNNLIDQETRQLFAKRFTWISGEVLQHVLGVPRAETKKKPAKPLDLKTLENGMIAHWTFNDPAKPGKDDTGNGNDAHLNNATHDPSERGGVLIFIGSNLFNTRLKQSINKDFTWAAWIKTLSDGTIMAHTFPNGANRGGTKSFFIRSGKLAIDVFGIDKMDLGNTSVADGQWHHVALTVQFEAQDDLDTSRFYIDGQLRQEKIWQMTKASQGQFFRLGFTNDNFPTQSYFIGRMDDVRVYNRTLSAEEIAGLAEIGSTKEKRPEIPRIATSEEALNIAGIFWAKDFSGPVFEKFANSTDIRAAPSSLLFASTMPTRQAREAIFNHFQLISAKAPGPFVDLEGFGEVMVDPALLVLMKSTWRSKAPTRPRKVDAIAGEVPAQLQWSQAGQKLVRLLNKQFHHAAKPGDLNAELPVKLHPKAKIASLYSLSWNETSHPNLPGIDLGYLQLHYVRIVEPMTPNTAKAAVKYYLTQAKKGAKLHGLKGERGTWIDGLETIRKSRRLRSIDIVLTAETAKSEAIGESGVVLAEAAMVRLQVSLARLQNQHQLTLEKSQGLKSDIENRQKDLTNRKKAILQGNFKTVEEYNNKRKEFTNQSKQYNKKLVEYQTVLVQLNKLQQQIAVVSGQLNPPGSGGAVTGAQQLVIEILTTEIDDPNKP